MKTHVFYYRIPYSNGKYHKNRLVLARKTELFYFFAESSRYINAKSLKDMYETPRKKIRHVVGTSYGRTSSIVYFFGRKSEHLSAHVGQLLDLVGIVVKL